MSTCKAMADSNRRQAMLDEMVTLQSNGTMNMFPYLVTSLSLVVVGFIQRMLDLMIILINSKLSWWLKDIHIFGLDYFLK
jgi:hypothetical protein